MTQPQQPQVVYVQNVPRSGCGCMLWTLFYLVGATGLLLGAWILWQWLT